MKENIKFSMVIRVHNYENLDLSRIIIEDGKAIRSPKKEKKETKLN